MPSNYSFNILEPESRQCRERSSEKTLHGNAVVSAAVENKCTLRERSLRLRVKKSNEVTSFTVEAGRVVSID